MYPGQEPERPRRPAVSRPALAAMRVLGAVAALLLAAPAAPAGARADASVAEPAGYWTGDINSPTPATLQGGQVIHTTQTSRLVKAGGAIIVDVSTAPRRPQELAPNAPWLPVPHPGIPGAVWIPGAGLGVIPAALNDFYRARLATLTEGDFSRALVIYCHQRCWLSWNAARRAIHYGYRNVSWFPEGIEGWKAKGLQTQTLEPQAPRPGS